MVQFPNRDPNIRMLMESVCKDSPMYDHVEELYHRDPIIKSLSKVKPEPTPTVVP